MLSIYSDSPCSMLPVFFTQLLSTVQGAFPIAPFSSCFPFSPTLSLPVWTPFLLTKYDRLFSIDWPERHFFRLFVSLAPLLTYFYRLFCWVPMCTPNSDAHPAVPSGLCPAPLVLLSRNFLDPMSPPSFVFMISVAPPAPCSDTFPLLSSCPGDRLLPPCADSRVSPRKALPLPLLT